MHRTYVRRRIVALAMALTAVAALSGRIAVAMAPAGVELAASHTYVVRPGDSLWAIAADVAPERDPRVVVHELLALNPEASEGLVPGAVLAVP